MDKDKVSNLEQDIGKAIADILAKHEGGFVTKWIALIEIVDDQGELGLWTTTSEGLMAWDTCGLLTHALHMQQRQTTCGHEDE